MFYNFFINSCIFIVFAAYISGGGGRHCTFPWLILSSCLPCYLCRYIAVGDVADSDGMLKVVAMEAICLGICC